MKYLKDSDPLFLENAIVDEFGAFRQQIGSRPFGDTKIFLRCLLSCSSSLGLFLGFSF
jgi:hypothetical protein